MAQSNPTVLTHATQFRPRSLLSHSRSPSRSPVRSHRLAAHDLDPLLSNLSPDSTLYALQATETISDPKQIPDALAKSIADASTFERELGIRAAFAAQKIQEWLKEVTAWPWPNARECALGMGFLPPRTADGQSPSSSDSYMGSLTEAQVQLYEKQVAEIKGSLDALEIDEVKDYVLDAHAISSWMSASDPDVMQYDRMSFGRMRDFTALITATVLRALPDLAHLNGLLNIWSVRISVIKTVPEFLSSLENTRVAIKEALGLLKLEKWAATLSRPKFEMTRTDLAEQVSSLGTTVDHMLDTLEGQQDRLPQTWIDTLETIELEFATWAVEAQRRVTYNEAISLAANKHKEPHAQTTQPLMREHNGAPSQDVTQQALNMGQEFVFPPNLDGLNLRVPPQLAHTTLAVPAGGHRREISEVSLADSAYSGLTDISKAEIIDAKTEVLASPKVNVVQSHSRSKSADLSSIFCSLQPQLQSVLMPSNAVRKDEQPRINHNRSKSLEISKTVYPAQLTNMSGQLVQPNEDRNQEPSNNHLGLSDSREDTFSGTTNSIDNAEGQQAELDRSIIPDTNSKGSTEAETDLAFEVEPASSQDLGNRPEHNDEEESIEDLPPGTPPQNVNPIYAESDLSSPLVQSSPVESFQRGSPALPRRSCKRVQLRTTSYGQKDAYDGSDPDTLTVSSDDTPQTIFTERQHPNSPKKAKYGEETLEAKIQDILTTLPANIRLADSHTPESTAGPSKASTTRPSSPPPALVLSPAKRDTTSRRNASNFSEVREFHLTRPGQARDAPPTKLFVRLIGENGERVMVRVGGGWADLGEYLREYSLHHGKRSITERRLEVASFPPAGALPRENVSTTSPLLSENSSKVPANVETVSARSKGATSPTSPSDWASLSDKDAGKGSGLTMPSNMTQPSEPTLLETDRRSLLHATPAAEPIQTSETIHSPMVATTTSSAGTLTSVSVPHPRTTSSHFQTTIDSSDSPSTITSTTTGPTVSTTTTSTHVSNVSGQKYTPLGAAGPKSGAKITGRRAMTYGALSASENDAWVEGMVGKARAVSGGNNPAMATSTNAPTSTPKSRRVSANAASLLSESPRSPSPSTASAKSGSPGSPSGLRPKSRMSLGDMSGIKRVFLRKKTEK